MVGTLELASCTSDCTQAKNVNCFANKSLVYVQPPIRRAIRQEKLYSEPTIKMNGDTTYSKSYIKNLDYLPRISYKQDRNPLRNLGSFNFDTVYNLSYMGAKRNVRGPCTAGCHLIFTGSHDMQTTNKLSYVNPGYVKTIPCKPFIDSKRRIAPAGDYKTIARESYGPFKTVIPVPREKRTFWQTKHKTDYRSTTNLSYQSSVPQFRKIVYKENSGRNVNGRMEKSSVYSQSYQTPGYFKKKSIE